MIYGSTSEPSAKLQPTVVRRILTGGRAAILLFTLAILLTFVDSVVNITSTGRINSVGGQIVLIVQCIVGLAIPIFLSPHLTQKRLQIIGFSFSADLHLSATAVMLVVSS